MRVTKYMRKNKILVGSFALLVVLIHASGIMEKIFGLEREETESKGLMEVLNVDGEEE
tara:strand:- start:176 stop:349 length:174 start_codon:yes stop_codon:yes gene_type:complete